jgi:hypothetical protein
MHKQPTCASSWRKGSSDARVESLLKLSSKFASFNPFGDFHAYALKLIAKEKTAPRQAKQTQQVAVRTESAPAAVVSPKLHLLLWLEI